jgi:hypothetical protein
MCLLLLTFPIYVYSHDWLGQECSLRSSKRMVLIFDPDAHAIDETGRAPGVAMIRVALRHPTPPNTTQQNY